MGKKKAFPEKFICLNSDLLSLGWKSFLKRAENETKIPKLVKRFLLLRMYPSPGGKPTSTLRKSYFAKGKASSSRHIKK